MSGSLATSEYNNLTFGFNQKKQHSAWKTTVGCLVEFYLGMVSFGSGDRIELNSCVYIYTECIKTHTLFHLYSEKTSLI